MARADRQGRPGSVYPLSPFHAQFTSSVTCTVTAVPGVGVITTVALYGRPGLKPATFTLKVIVEDCWEVSLPEVGVTDNHDADGMPTVQDSISPPVFCIVMVCAVGLLPAVVVNVKPLGLTVIGAEVKPTLTYILRMLTTSTVSINTVT